MNWKNIAALTLAASLLSGCSVASRLVYHIDINQGNYVAQEDVSMLRIGMTKQQVEYVLGTPMLVQPEYPNIWYYIYYHKPGHNTPIQKDLILTFNQDNHLSRMSGDFKASPDFNQPLQQ